MQVGHNDSSCCTYDETGEDIGGKMLHSFVPEISGKHRGNERKAINDELLIAQLGMVVTEYLSYEETGCGRSRGMPAVEGVFISLKGLVFQ